MTIEQIKEKVQYGDFTTLGGMLKASPAAAKMRFLRGDKQAKEALEQILLNREKMILDFQNENLIKGK